MIRKFNEKIADNKVNSRGRRTIPAAYHTVHPTDGICL
jgi:hypothetical protein